MDLNRYLTTRRRQIDQALRRHLSGTRNPSLRRAMSYSVLSGGKRVRPVLCLAAAEAVGSDASQVLDYACALELIHAYSLIHDDLPAMDDDTLRRGKPTSHVVFGEAMAILAGDALLTEAFHIAARRGLTGGAGSSRRALQIQVELAAAAGAGGMIAGQVEDIRGEHRKLGLKAVEAIHRQKTGALIRAAVRIGAVAADADRAALSSLTRYAEHLGLAFQVVDDILDGQATTAETGKTEDRDREREKSTFVSCLGPEKAKRAASELLDRALASLKRFDERADPLRELARRVVSRAAC